MFLFNKYGQSIIGVSIPKDHTVIQGEITIGRSRMLCWENQNSCVDNVKTSQFILILKLKTHFSDAQLNCMSFYII